MSIDALKESEPLPVDGSDSEIGGGDGERQVDPRGKPELRAIAADLERVYQECMNDGSDESTANTIACERVLGKTKRLGLGCSSSKKGTRSNLSSVARDEEIAALKEDNQTLKDEMNQMQSTMKAMVEYFRAQGVEFHPHNPPGDDN
ncbi:PREDICTED: uncharacterized protein LOC105970575 [Erythranthe guttata]|uniref:uncharacterized protein LOC105970575 n=1 Tax=Erythranthe guttata TaxID=4155 RepID=UPI00064DA716|nr:PREDICTED: uncharacterized protein LOC105970575 [Erythranthe guttata]|eukprot:XP_012850860.1 PREDICTED: uncharacterized protein LOC105970575 [Erythranthe guttata]